MNPLSSDIQAAIEARIAPLSQQSLNLAGDPQGVEGRHRVAAAHWVAYQGSSYPEGRDSMPSEMGWTQSRELEYQHYVEVQDLRRDFMTALRLHETLMSLIAGLRPNLEGVRSPLRLVRDEPVSARSNGETLYRYRATYRILCLWEAVPPESLVPAPVWPEVTGFEFGLWRSFVDEVGASSSRLDKVIKFEVD